MELNKDELEFQVPDTSQGIIEIIEDEKGNPDRVRFNWTLDRVVEVEYRKGHSLRVDLAQLAGSPQLNRLVSYGLKQHMTDGAPTSESEILPDGAKPKGKQWTKAKVVTLPTGKLRWTRALTLEEKIEAAQAHAEVRLEVLYGTRELQERTGGASPLVQEFGRMLRRFILNPKSGIVDSDGNKFNHKSLPSDMVRMSGISTDSLQAAAFAIGVEKKRITHIYDLACEAVEGLDSLFADIEI